MNKSWFDEDFTGPSTVERICAFGSALPFTIITMLTLVGGLVGNVFIIAFSLKRLKLNPTAYMVFLVNLSANNLFGIAVSLPCFYLGISTNVLRTVSFQMANCICFIKAFFHFNCLGVGLHTLAAMCYDRYEAFTKLPADKRFTVSRAKKTVIVIWVVITVMTFASLIGYLITITNDGALCFSMHAPPFNIPISSELIVTGYMLIAVTTIWITVCNTIFSFTLTKVHRQIHQHMEQVSSILGTTRVKIEINLYKIAIVTVLAYSIFWIPYGVARGVYSSYRFRVQGVACFYAMGTQLSYVVFGILPYIYIRSDKNARKQFCSLFKRGGQVHPMPSNDSSA